MRLDRSIALIQLPDMHVMNLFDAVDTLHGLDQRVELNIRRSRSHQYANRPANHAEALVENIGRYRHRDDQVGEIAVVEEDKCAGYNTDEKRKSGGSGKSGSGR